MSAAYSAFDKKKTIILMSLLILIVYANSLTGSWHLDDTHRIPNNSSIHMENLSYTSIVNSFFVTNNDDKQRKLYRPVTNLTFALNWFFHKDDVKGYHVVNIVIHIIAASLLFRIIILLFLTPVGRRISEKQDTIVFVASMTAVLWAVHPIQAQAVNYIVQRMAILTAMFYFLGIFFFLKSKLSPKSMKKTCLYILTVISFILALGSKENAVTFPLSLLLIEFLFFERKSIENYRFFLKTSVIATLMTIIIAIFIFFIRAESLAPLIELYDKRSFSMGERALTQFKILLFYLSLIFYPSSNRFSISHDYTLSNSLFDPPTTFLAIIIILILVVTSLLYSKKHTFFSFSILFFFITHAVESTILPLEMIFEHRNYLPSAFIFLPFSMGIKSLIDYIKQSGNNLTYWLLIVLIPVLIIGLGLGTRARNLVWENEKTLWEDAMEKAPASARPYQNLAAGYYLKMGDIEKVYELNKKSYGLKDDTPQSAKVIALNNMAMYYAKKKKYEKSIEILKKSLAVKPDRVSQRSKLVLAYMFAGQWKNALKNEKINLQRYPDDPNFLNRYGFILIKLQKYEQAYAILTKSLKLDPDKLNTLFNLGIAALFMHKYDTALYFLEKTREKSPDRIAVYFLLIRNFLLQNQIDKAEEYVDQMISQFSIRQILHCFTEFSDKGMYPEIDSQWIKVLVKKAINKHLTLNSFKTQSKIDHRDQFQFNWGKNGF